MRGTLVIIALLCVALTQSLFGQQTLTLDQARQLAIERNMSVTQAQNNVESAQSNVLAAYGNYLPTLSASAGWTRYQNTRPGTATVVVGGEVIPGNSGFTINNSFSTGVRLNYLLFDGFGREGLLNRATSNAISSEEQAARTRQTIVYQVESGYINILRNEQLVKVSEENLKRDRRQLERITESNKVGALSVADVYRQQSQVAADELNLITTQNNFDKAKADLLALIGLDVNATYAFSDPSVDKEITQSEFEQTAEKYKDFDQVSNRALNARPDYVSAQQTYDATDAGVTVARSGYFPTISAFAGYGLNSTELNQLSDYRTLNWGVNLSWSIFDGFGTNQQIQSAQVLKKNAKASLVQAERDIMVDVKKALLDLEAARKQYDASQKGLISATEDRKIAEERYNLGAGTLLDLLVANAGYVNAEANKVNASYNYIIAKRNVEYVIGERTY